MNPVTIFEQISISPPYEKIYSRLGFKKKTTEITAVQRKQTDSFIEDAFALITLKGCSQRAAIDNNDGKDVAFSGKMIFRSTQLARFLRNCREALFIGATAGSAVMEAIASKTGENNFSAAVVYDATASEMTDAALDWLMDYANSQLRREGKVLLPRRFSAGYADLELENQGKIYERLEMRKLGVKINSQFLLLPEKSVTAITGICG